MISRWRAMLLGSLSLLGLAAGLPAQAPPPQPVEVAPAVREKVADSASLLGDVEVRRTSTVAASIEGQVIAFLAEEGQWVKKGDTLAQLRDDLLRIQIESARAARDEAGARHRKAKADLERAEALIGKDAVTPKNLDAYRADADIASQQLVRAEAEIRGLEIDLANKTIKAPFDGQVITELTEIGEWLPRGGAVARLADLEEVYIRIQLPERFVGRVRLGEKWEVAVEALPGSAYKGSVESIGSVGDASARTFPVRLRIPNPERTLRGGMSAQVRFRFERQEPILLVPKDAVLLQGQRGIVYAVRGGRAEMVPVAVGESYSDRLEIHGEISENEQVVIRGNERLRPGAPVRIIAPAEGAKTGGAPGTGESGEDRKDQ